MCIVFKKPNLTPLISILLMSFARNEVLRPEVSGPKLDYLTDGRSNQLRISPQPSVSQSIVKVGEVNENVMRHWYYRDIADFQKHKHRNVVYSQLKEFNWEVPEYSQIKRVILDEYGHPVANQEQFLCMHCQEPRFFGPRLLIAHLADVHWPIELPSFDAAVKVIYSE